MTASTLRTQVLKVSGGEVAIQHLDNGGVRYWMNGKRINASDLKRKLEG